jgi:ATP-binding cassette subfamily B protein
MDRAPKKKRYSKAVFRYFLTPFKKHKALIFLVLFGIGGVQVIELALPLYLKQLVNALAVSSPNAETASILLGIVFTIGLLWVARWLMSRLEHFSNVFLETKVMATLVTDAFSYLMDHSHNYFISRFAGSLTHKVSKYAKSFQMMYDIVVLRVYPSFLFVVGATVIMFVHNAVLGTILLVWLLLFISFQIL